MSDEKEKNEKKKDNKTDRLDRLETELETIKAGLLLLLSMVSWHNMSINPVGAHNPDHEQEYPDTLEEAIENGGFPLETKK